MYTDICTRAKPNYGNFETKYVACKTVFKRTIPCVLCAVIFSSSHKIYKIQLTRTQ